MLTSNKGLEKWGNVLGDEIMAAAHIDRLLHHCHIVNIRGNRYRMREYRTSCGLRPSSPARESCCDGSWVGLRSFRSLRPTQDP